MKISKITLMVALIASLNLGTSSIYAMDPMMDDSMPEEQLVVADESNGNYVPVITPVAETTKDVAHGTGRVLKGTGEVITLRPGEGVEDIAGGTGEIVEGAVKFPGRLFGVIE